MPFKKSFTKRPAVSLVIAMVMVLAFMLMTADVMQVMTRTQNIAKGAKFSDQAQLNAQLGLELGLYAQNKPEKFQKLLQDMKKSDTNLVVDEVNNTLTNAYGTISWKTTEQKTGGEACYEKDPTKGTGNDMAGCDANKYFVYPYPGTGTAGGKNCDIKTQQLRKNNPWYEDMYYLIKGEKYPEDTSTIDTSEFANSVGNLYALDHPCLWNTLKSGSSAEIPLFRIGPDGTEIGANHITDFYVRARLQCKNGGTCTELPGSERWKLLATNDNKNTRALIWNIVADCTLDGLCYLSELGIEKNIKNTTDSVIIYGILGSPSYSSIIKNWILGYKKENNTIISGKDGSKNEFTGPIKEFLTNTGKWLNAGISKPYFHLSIAAPLTVSNGAPGQTVDTIEYQIIYKQDQLTPLVTNPTVISQGSSGGYTTSLQSSLTKQTGSFNFSLVGK